MGVRRGGEKAGLHIKDKFWTTNKVKMGSWGITMRESDSGVLLS